MKMRRERLAEFVNEITAMENAGWRSTMRRAANTPNLP